MGVPGSTVEETCEETGVTCEAFYPNVIPKDELCTAVLSRTDKYKAKAFIDTFVYRGGDVLGAQTEGVLGRLGMGLAALVSVAVPLAVVWAALGIWLGRQQESHAERRMAADLADEPAASR